MILLLLAALQNPDLDRKVAALLPKEGEDRWMEIGWEPNLVKARAEAQRQGKPLLLWIMDGNVLGCT